MSNNKAIVLTHSWPELNKGYGFAVDLSLKIYKKIFTEVHLIVISDQEKPTNYNVKGIKNHYINVNKSSIYYRGLKNMFNKHPIVVEHFSSSSTKKQLIGLVSEIIGLKENAVIVYEDIPITYYLPILKNEFKYLTHLIRSHNVLYKSFLGGSKGKNIILKKIWENELEKILKFESNRLKVSDKAYSISENDKKNYKEYLSTNIDGVIPVGIDVESYDDISKGDSNKIIYLGKADFRKASGLNNFLKEGWPKIRSSKPHMEFHLAGQNTEVFHQPENNIYGYGFVEDPKEFLGKGLFFINPQMIGSGVKIKSLVALASKKVLITTSIGVEGIEGESGRDYIEENSYEVLANKIVDLFNDEKSTESIRQNALKLVKNNYSNKKIINEVTPSLKKDLNICYE